MIKDTEEVKDAATKELTEEQKSIINIAKRMMIMYVGDEFTDRIDREEFAASLEQIKIHFGPTDDTTGGFYHPASQIIIISTTSEFEAVENEKIQLDKIGTIVHEFGHYFSDVYSKSNNTSNLYSGCNSISKFFEEGMADVFSEECVNHFLRNVPEQELDALNIQQMAQPYVGLSDYRLEADFVRTTLEVLKQSKGTAKEAEFEYFLGDKAKFLELCKEVLGDKYIEILEEQKDDRNVAQDANIRYNEQLRDIVKGLGVEFAIEPTNEDGSVNVYANRANIIESIAREQDVRTREETLYNMAIQDGTFEGLMKLKEQYGICTINLIKKLEDSGRYSTLDLIKYISSFDFTAESRSLEDFAVVLNMEQLASEDFANLDMATRKNILTMVMQTEESNVQLLTAIEKLEASAIAQSEQTGEELTEQEKLLTLRCKYLLDDECKGERLTEILSILKDKDIVDLAQNELEFCFLVKEDLRQYIQTNAKTDVVGKAKLINFFANFEGKQLSGQDEFEYVDPVSILCKKEYYTQIYKDLAHIKEGMTLDETFSKEVYSEGHYSGEGKYIPMQGLTLAFLAGIQQKTVLLEPFEKGNVKSVIRASGIGESFSKLSDEEKTIVLDALDDMKVEPNFMTNLESIVDYTGTMLSPEQNEDIGKRKAEMLQVISSKLGERETPVEDMYRLLKSSYKELPTHQQYICNILNGKLAQNIEDGKLQDVSMEKLAVIAATSKKIVGLDHIQETTTKALTSVMKEKEFTTEGFIEAIEDFDYSVDREVLIQSYLQSMEKDNDDTQRKLLTQLMEFNRKGIKISNPQYIKYQAGNAEEKEVVFLNGEDGLTAYSSTESALESDIELIEEQNKRKAGLFSVFKSKKAKEMVTKTVVLEQPDEENRTSKILNIYETGRIEIATVVDSGKKRKVINREDVETTIIGRNATLIATPEKSGFEEEITSKVLGAYEYTEVGAVDDVVPSRKKENGEINI